MSNPLSDLRLREIEHVLLASAKAAPAFETYARNMLAFQLYVINKHRERVGLPALELPAQGIAAGTDMTPKSGVAEGKSPVPERDAPEDSQEG